MRFFTRRHLAKPLLSVEPCVDVGDRFVNTRVYASLFFGDPLLTTDLRVSRTYGLLQLPSLPLPLVFGNADRSLAHGGVAHRLVFAMGDLADPPLLKRQGLPEDAKLFAYGKTSLLAGAGPCVHLSDPWLCVHFSRGPLGGLPGHGHPSRSTDLAWLGVHTEAIHFANEEKVSSFRCRPRPSFAQRRVPLGPRQLRQRSAGGRSGMNKSELVLGHIELEVVLAIRCR